MRRWRHHHRNGISSTNVTADFDNTHDSSPSDQASIGCAVEDCGGETGAEAVQLCAGIAQTSHDNYRFGANLELGASWQCQ